MPPSGTPAAPPPVYVQPAVEPQPPARPVAGTPADCTPIGVDQDTGQTICAY
jgi:hypothetical protein